MLSVQIEILERAKSAINNEERLISYQQEKISSVINSLKYRNQNSFDAQTNSLICVKKNLDNLREECISLISGLENIVELYRECEQKNIHLGEETIPVNINGASQNIFYDPTEQYYTNGKVESIYERFISPALDNSFNVKPLVREFYKNYLGETVKGVGKKIISSGMFFIDGVFNVVDNLQEQARSNGTMSDGRVVAETVIETVATVAVGTVVASIVGTVVAGPALVAASTGVIVTGIDAGVRAVTDQDLKEHVSDRVFDLAEMTVDASASWYDKLLLG